MGVGDHLHFDVPGASDQLLQEHHARTESALRLIAGALVGVSEVIGRIDSSDAASATPGGGLQHQRVADPLGCRKRVVQSAEAAAAPRRDRHADLFGEQLGTDFVAELAHRVRARPDEGDTRCGDLLGEVGVLGNKAPADPHRVRARFGEHPHQQFVVEVGTR